MDTFDLMIGASDATLDQIHKVYERHKSYSGNFQLIVSFKPDERVELSIIWGKYAYGANQGLFEVALLIDGSLNPGPFAQEWYDDQVLGYQTANEVRVWLARTAEYARTLEVQDESSRIDHGP